MMLQSKKFFVVVFVVVVVIQSTPPPLSPAAVDLSATHCSITHSWMDESNLLFGNVSCMLHLIPCDVFVSMGFFFNLFDLFIQMSGSSAHIIYIYTHTPNLAIINI